MIFPILIAALGLSAIMATAWWVQKRTGKSGWIDAFWSFGVGAAAVGLALVPVAGTEYPTWRQLLAALLAAIWSGRLGFHIVSRTLGGGDDPRYAQLKKEWGASADKRLFFFLQVQALCAFVLALAVFAAAQNPAPGLRWSDFAGAALLALAIAGEGIADRQLRGFLKDSKNKSKVADTGLWSWSRHPNYFFEWLGWFAYVLIGFNLTGAYWWWLGALAAPAMMYWLLVHASGIPPLEAHMLRKHGDRFRAYQRRVNAFFPAPPGAGAKS